MLKNIKVLVIVITVLLCGCSPSMETEPQGTVQIEKKPVSSYRIGYSCMDLENSFYQEFCDKLMQKCDELNVALYLHDGKSDVAQQISILDKWIEEGLDAVICSPVDPTVIQSSADMCMDAGIPFINIDSECERKTAYIGVSQFDYGYWAGKIAADWINENLAEREIVTCGIIDTPQSFDFIERTNGIIAGLTDNCKAAKIVAHEAYTTESDAFDVTWAILEEDIHLDCMITATEAGISGAYRAFLASGINTSQRCLVGLGASRDVLKKIADNTIVRGSVDQGIEEFAEGALTLAIDAISGVPVSRKELPIIPVTIDNVENILSKK